MIEKQKLIFRLLKEGHINEDEAVILMKSEKEYVSIPYDPNPVIGPVVTPYYYTTNNLTA